MEPTRPDIQTTPSADRWIALEGAVNVRDAGGLTTRDGGRIATGRLIRADNLQSLTPHDVSLLTDELGVTDVVDMRSDFEVDREGPRPARGLGGHDPPPEPAAGGGGPGTGPSAGDG